MATDGRRMTRSPFQTQYREGLGLWLCPLLSKAAAEGSELSGAVGEEPGKPRSYVQDRTSGSGEMSAYKVVTCDAHK